jgi:chromosome segregation ATPase
VSERECPHASDDCNCELVRLTERAEQAIEAQRAAAERLLGEEIAKGNKMWEEERRKLEHAKAEACSHNIRANEAERALAEYKDRAAKMARAFDTEHTKNIDLRATLARVTEENARLAKEHTHCHEWNGKLVHEHYDLGDRIRALTATLARSREDNERLRRILVADGLDPDMPIPPGLALQLARVEGERGGWTHSDVSRLADQQGQDLQNARQHIVALTVEADGLRKEVDRLTELVKLDAGTIRLREREIDALKAMVQEGTNAMKEADRLREDLADLFQRACDERTALSAERDRLHEQREANGRLAQQFLSERDGLLEQLASSVRDVKAVLETNHGMRAALEEIVGDGSDARNVAGRALAALGRLASKESEGNT